MPSLTTSGTDGLKTQVCEATGSQLISALFITLVQFVNWVSEALVQPAA